MWENSFTPVYALTTQSIASKVKAKQVFFVKLALKCGQTCRTLESRIVLYHAIRSARQLGLSYAQMQRKLFEDTGIRLSKASISYWLRGIHDPSGSLNRFHPDPSPELSYEIGVALSDGKINVHDYHGEILLSVTDKDFASEFGICLGRVLGRGEPYKSQVERKKSQMDSAGVNHPSPQISQLQLVQSKKVD
ncbi:hypothetical protein AUI51_00040 [archaeon 13_1_40CM_2_52_4]|nr:MAG: hypothetical protein AUI51_00040 [archaeon 13_1_40CM_2_52_4]